jgi:acetate kinase
MRVLAVNSGSSSLKLRVVGADDEIISSADLPASDLGALGRFVAGNHGLDAAAHRFVHGGALRRATLLDAPALRAIEAAGRLAPLHSAVALECARALGELRPELPQVACLDTAFHRTLPPAAFTYALPRDWIDKHDIRRYGFHGLSHAWASGRAAEMVERPPATLRTVTAHLGAGVSLAAVAGGRCVDTTMGMTPNDGVAMATRSGAVDPGVVLLLAEREGGPQAAREGLERRAGLLGLSGLSSDMRTLLTAAETDDHARLAIEVYVHRLRAAVAAMAAALGGLDALVFTGGVGENAAPIRAAVCHGLGFLGVELDDEANERLSDDGLLSAADSRATVLLVHAREELEMARETRAVLAHRG